MGNLSERSWEKVSAPVLEQFRCINDALLSVSPDAYGDLTTIYIKYSLSPSATSPVYAVVWVKNRNQLLVGLALPSSLSAPELTGSPPGIRYKGLTKYFVVKSGDPVPNQIGEWARLAFANVSGEPQGQQD